MKQGIPSDRILVERAKFAVSSELKRKEQLNLPVAKFDAKSGQIYMHNSDGSISLHARCVSFEHPVSHKLIEAEAPVPEDNLWKALTEGMS